MNRNELLAIIRTLPEKTPTLSRLEQQLGVGPGQGRAWYSSQKVHWIRWLSEYHTPGPYQRNIRRENMAHTIYNRLMCPSMIFWLPEALNCDKDRIAAAFNAALAAPKNGASQSAAIRRALPWDCVQEKIQQDPDFQHVLRF